MDERTNAGEVENGWLVLQRELHGRVRLDVPGWPPVWVMVSEIKGDRIKLAFRADRRIEIFREELL